VPGWYAVASIKWLQRIIVTDRPFNGYYQTLDYAYWATRGDLAELRPVSELQIKAEISRPALDETVSANSKVTIRGAAWTGSGEITRVEVSTDAGTSWREAKLIDKAVPNAWRRWEFVWQTPAESGKHTLMARAYDSRGQTQPRERDPNRGTYMINHLLPIVVEVR
jgi:DMSO/TMAO reductase YedYZ molybdopterin-dependent catalytic subunit